VHLKSICAVLCPELLEHDLAEPHWGAWYSEPKSLSSDTPLDIPNHVRQHLQKTERCSLDRKLLSCMEMQIAILRAIGQPPPAFLDNFPAHGAHYIPVHVSILP
jgi:hypothetical protein